MNQAQQKQVFDQIIASVISDIKSFDYGDNEDDLRDIYIIATARIQTAIALGVIQDGPDVEIVETEPGVFREQPSFMKLVEDHYYAALDRIRGIVRDQNRFQLIRLS